MSFQKVTETTTLNGETYTMSMWVRAKDGKIESCHPLLVKDEVKEPNESDYVCRNIPVTKVPDKDAYTGFVTDGGGYVYAPYIPLTITSLPFPKKSVEDHYDSVMKGMNL